MTPNQGRVLAAVDLGSNSFHMIVARHESGRLQVLDRLREMVRLASGLDDQHQLSEEKQQAGLECLARFGERLRHLHAEDVRAVGTNTLRKARNGDEFLDRGEQALGHPINVIAGREEARLIYLGAVHGSPATDGRRLVLDIGGGSTEVIVGVDDRPDALYSLFMGCVSVSRKYFPDGRIDRNGIKAARVAADLELAPVVAPVRAQGWRQALGCSGTVRAVNNLVHELDPACMDMDAAHIKALVGEFAKYRHIDDVPFAALSAERRPVLLGGLIILERLFANLKIKKLRVADGALREGLIYDMLGAELGRDARDLSVAALQERYQVDTTQAQRVENIVIELLHQVRDAWSIGSAQTERLLRYAARLHEIGLSLAHSHYHRHGAYIAQNADLPGFNRQEQILLAWLILGHRRRIPEIEPEHVRAKWRRRLPRMLAVLRIATDLARARDQTHLPKLVAEATESTLTLRFGAPWLRRHPLTRADLAREAQQLEGIGIGLTVA